MPTLDEAKKNTENGNYKEALKVLHILLSADPYNININFEAARAYSLSGNDEKAVKLLKNIMRNDCRDVYVFEFFFKIYKGADLFYVDGILDIVNNNFSKDCNVFLEIAKFFLDIDEKKSIIYLQKYIDNGGLDENVFLLLAKLYRESNEFIRAKNILAKIKSLKKDSLLELFRINLIENKTAEAKKNADMLLNNFYDADLVCETAQVYFDGEYFEDLKKIMLPHLSGNVNNIKLRLLLSKCYEGTGEIKKATDELIFILSLNILSSSEKNDVYKRISDLNKIQKNGITALKTILEARKFNYPDIYYFDELRCIINRLIYEVKEYILSGNQKDAVSLSEQIVAFFPLKKKMLENILLNESEIKEHKIKLKSKPRILEITLTNKCNLNCVMCSNIKMKNWDISDKLKNEIISLMPYLEQINWLGGEVFLYKDFKELFDTAAQNYVKQIISTNALLINEEIIKKFMHYDVELSISIDGATKEVYEKIRVGGSFDKLVSQLALINKLKKIYNPGMKKRLCAVVLEENYTQLEDIVDFAHKYEFDSITFTPVSNYTDNSFVFYKKMDLDNKIDKIKEKSNKYGIELENCLPSQQQYVSLLKDKYGPDFESVIDERMKRDKEETINQGNPYSGKIFYIAKDSKAEHSAVISCFSPWQKLFVDCAGIVKTNCNCRESLILGDINGVSIKEIWNSENMVNLRHNLLVNYKYSGCADNCKFNVIPYEKLRYTY
ncbi:MAG: radical SAM protein [Endomicrobiaceae bacterium]